MSWKLIENFALESFCLTHIQLLLKETREGNRRAGNYIEENVHEISQGLALALDSVGLALKLNSPGEKDTPN